MTFGRYLFETLFDYYPSTGVIVPKYTTLINGYRIEKGIQISYSTHTGGVNLFQAVGKAFAASWDTKNRTITIVGVYP